MYVLCTYVTVNMQCSGWKFLCAIHIHSFTTSVDIEKHAVCVKASCLFSNIILEHGESA